MAGVISALASVGVKGETPYHTIFTLTLDASYPAGGYPIVDAQAGYTAVDHVKCDMAVDGSGNVLLAWWDRAAKKVRLAYPTGGVTAAPAAVAQPLLTAGGTTVTGSAATGPITPGAGKEVPTGCNLAGFALVCTATGT